MTGSGLKNWPQQVVELRTWVGKKKVEILTSNSNSSHVYNTALAIFRVFFMGKIIKPLTLWWSTLSSQNFYKIIVRNSRKTTMRNSRKQKCIFSKQAFWPLRLLPCSPAGTLVWTPGMLAPRLRSTARGCCCRGSGPPPCRGCSGWSRCGCQCRKPGKKAKQLKFTAYLQRFHK